MTLNNFIFYGDWLKNIKDLPVEVQDKVIAEIVRYGTDTESLHEDDLVVSAMVNFTKRAIDQAKDDYQKKIEAGKNYGRKKSLDDKEVYELAKSGKKSGEIAEILGVSKSSIDHSDGWKNRKSDEFVF